MSLKIAVPEGHVDAYCTFCVRDVVIPESTMACPHCGQNVHPLSLARVPEEHNRATAIARMVAEPSPPIVATLRPPPPPPRPQPVAKAAETTVERIELPPNLAEWYRGSREARHQLATEETELVEKLRRVRQARKLLDGLLARIVEPAGEAERVPPPGLEMTPVLAEPEPPRPATAAPSTNGHAEMPPAAPSASRWARLFDCCINCGTTERAHGSQGRCSSCATYWNRTGNERPPGLYTRGGIPS